MANTIQIKRGAFSTIPTSFLDGEFGWANDTHQLFVGDGTTKHEVLMKEAYSNTSFLYATAAGNPENKTPSEVLGILSGQAITDFSINNKKVTNLADPVNPQDAVNFRTMQISQSGLAPKDEVRVATTVAGTLSTDFVAGAIVDGITLALNDRILVKNQVDATENGIRVVQASGSPIRPADFDTTDDVIYGAYMFVQEGTTLHDTGWVLATDGNIVIGTTNLNFVQFSRAGQLTQGDGINISGNVVNVTTDVLRDADFAQPNSILKADSANSPIDLAVNLNSVIGRVSSNITNITIDADLSTVSSNYDTIAYAKTIKDYVDAQVAGKDTFIDLLDTPIAYADGDFVRSTATDIEFATFDTSEHGSIGVTNNAPNSNAFYLHDQANTGTHGAGANTLLNSGSLIDCGTF